MRELKTRALSPDLVRLSALAAVALCAQSALADPPPPPIAYPYVNQQMSNQQGSINPLNNPGVSESPDLSANDTDSPAVEDVTGKSTSWWDDFLNHRSPLHFALSVTETYDDNIFIQPQKTSDFVTRVAPSLSFVLGDKTNANANYLSVFFKPTYIHYADNSNQDAEDYFVDVNYQHQFTRLTLGLEQRYEKLSNSTIDVGNLVKRDIYTTIGTATYDYNDNLNFVGTFTQNISAYQSSADADTNEWIGDLYSLYKVLPKLSIGIGPRIGWVDIAGAPNQTYQDGLVHLIYEATGKVTVTLAGGGEVREYQDNTPSDVTPVYEFNVDYLATDSTTITLNSFRHRTVSYSQVGQDYLDTVIDAKIRQRIFQSVYLHLSGGYDNAQYRFASTGITGPQREDNYYFINTGAEWKPNNWLGVNASYQYSKDDSNFNQNSFNDNQVTLGATISY